MKVYHERIFERKNLALRKFWRNLIREFSIIEFQKQQNFQQQKTEFQ